MCCLLVHKPVALVGARHKLWLLAVLCLNLIHWIKNYQLTLSNEILLIWHISTCNRFVINTKLIYACLWRDSMNPGIAASPPPNVSFLSLPWLYNYYLGNLFTASNDQKLIKFKHLATSILFKAVICWQKQSTILGKLWKAVFYQVWGLSGNYTVYHSITKIYPT